MSSVWLTASAVRYITCRLLRARASQEFCGSSACELEDAAAFLLRHRVDDPRAIVALGGAGRMLIDVGQMPLLDSSDGPGVEHQRAADLHLVAAGEHVLAGSAGR